MSSARKSLFVCLVLLAGLKGAVQAQGDFTLWADFDYRTYVKPRLWLGGDAGFRGVFDAGNGITIYARPTINYRFSPIINVGGGIAGFNTFSHLDNLFEFRGFQTLNCNWPRGKFFKYQSRLQVEERGFYRSSDLERGDNSSFRSVRVRIQLGLTSVYFNLSDDLKNVYFTGSVEMFASSRGAKENVFVNQYRAVGGFGQLLRSGWRYEVDFIGQFSRSTVAQLFDQNSFIVRTRIFLLKKESS